MNVLEHLESFGAKIMMSGPIGRELCVGRNRDKSNQRFFSIPQHLFTLPAYYY